jgi:hypothetical protein
MSHREPLSPLVLRGLNVTGSKARAKVRFPPRVGVPELDAVVVLLAPLLLPPHPVKATATTMVTTAVVK